MAYELRLEQYSGPLEKLLELIEERKLAISEISLAQVTEDFLTYVRALHEVDTSTLADFIVVASRLLYIKTKSLLPDLVLTGEEEDEIKDLTLRLALYREFRPAMRVVLRLWGSPQVAVSRAYLQGVFAGSEANGTGFFYPGSGLGAEMLPAALGGIFEMFRTLQLETETVARRIVTVEEKIQEIVSRLATEREMSFRSASRSKPNSEVIALFLAILHLARENYIRLEQEGHFSDILIRNKGKESDIRKSGPED